MQETPVLDFASYRKIVVVSGPGLARQASIYAESPSSPRGRWRDREIHPSYLAAFRADPADSWDYWRAKRLSALARRPGPGHAALALAEHRICKPGSLRILTSAEDGLHQESGSLNVVELRGNVLRSRCFSDACDLIPFEDRSVSGDPLPACPRCGALLRPDVLMQGERLQARYAARALSSLVGCDLFVAVASSALVFPTAKYVHYAKREGARAVYINRDSIFEFDPLTPFDEEYIGDAAELLPRLMGLDPGSAERAGFWNLPAGYAGVSKAEEMPEADEPIEMEDIDEARSREAWADARADMLSTGRWYEAPGSFKGVRIGDRAPEYRPVEGPRLLALGRSDNYVDFIERMSREGRGRYYQSDFMVWIDPSDAYTSLLWYIDSAERIDVSLEGIGVEDLRAATSGSEGRAPSRRQLGIRYMTSWEMNQLWWGPALDRTWWHIMGSMGIDEAREVLGGKVNLERIVEDDRGEAAR
jgi:NAD-dependent deacetylase